jgi:quercetin dioxygenase-like cupin family protein
MQVYDYRTDNRNVLITPEIRARLYHMKPGQVDGRHSHDLGVEVFLILEGKAEFTIEGHSEVLGPGQMCIAMADEVHQVRNLLPDQPTVMYLSVTPHILPTHTGRTESDDRLPHRFQSHEPAMDEERSVVTSLDAHLQRTADLAEAARSFEQVHTQMVAQWHRALEEGDAQAATAARNAMSGAVEEMHKRLYAASETWNALAVLAEQTP